MTGHDRGGGWVHLSMLCDRGWDGCYDPTCLCRCHDHHPGDMTATWRRARPGDTPAACPHEGSPIPPADLADHLRREARRP